MEKLIKKILRESVGVSFDVREWSDIVYNEIMKNQDMDRIIIDGYDHYNTYEKFPIDYLVIDFYEQISGYDPEKSGYDNDGYYVVLLYIQPTIVKGLRDYDLKTTLNHELKHAYQDYKRLSKGHGNIDTTKESKEFYTPDFIGLLNSGNNNGPIKTILSYYYYLSNLERDAYLENVYDGNTGYEEQIRDILNKDFNQFNTPSSYKNWGDVTNLDIPLLNKFNTPEDFVNYSEVRLKKEAGKILKKINKLRYVHGV